MDVTVRETLLMSSLRFSQHVAAG